MTTNNYSNLNEDALNGCFYHIENILKALQTGYWRGAYKHAWVLLYTIVLMARMNDRNDAQMRLPYE